jgi:hypothetical protein
MKVNATADAEAFYLHQKGYSDSQENIIKAEEKAYADVSS